MQVQDFSGFFPEFRILRLDRLSKESHSQNADLNRL